MSNPILVLGAAVVAAASYYFLRDEDADCFDANLPSGVRAELVKLLSPETGGEKLTDLIARTRHMRVVAGIMKPKHPKASKCLVRRAESLEAVIRKTGGDVAKTKQATPPTPKKGAKKGTAKKTAGKQPKPTPAKAGEAMGDTTPGFGTFKIPNAEGPGRDKAVLKLIKAGRKRPITWKPVDCSRDGIQCTVFVSDDAVAMGDGEKFVRVNVRHKGAERIAKALGAYLPTTRISDLAWQQADVVLTPQISFNYKDPRFSTTEGMYRHSLNVERVRKGRGGLIRPVGKDWVLSNWLVEGQAPAGSNAEKFNWPGDTREINFGWHFVKATKYKSPGGLPVIQPRSAFHRNHSDYSQTITLVNKMAKVNGKLMPLAELLKHPTLSRAVSDEGPLLLTRHPAVGEDAPLAVS